MTRRPIPRTALLLAAGLGAAIAGSLLVRSGAARRSPPPTHAEAPARETAPDVPDAAGGAERTALDGDTIRVLGRGPGGVRPVAGAMVSLDRVPLTAEGRVAHRAETDREGVAALATVPAGRWVARVMARGFLGETAPIEIAEGEHASPLLEIVLDELARVRGSVVDGSGRPMPGTHLHLRFDEGRFSIRTPLHPLDSPQGLEPVAGPDGRFAFGAPPDTSIVLEALHPTAGRVENAVDPLSPGETRDVRLVLRRPTNVVGRAVPFLPVAGAGTVTLCRVVENRSGLVDERSAAPLADGTFRFGNVTPGDKVLLYSRSAPEGIEIGMIEATAVEEETTDVGDLRVAPSVLDVLAHSRDLPDIRRTVDLNGAVLPAGRARGSYPVHARLESGAQFRIAGLPAGRLRLVASLLDEGGAGPDPAFREANWGAEYDGVAGEAVFVFERRAPTGKIRVRVSPPPGIAPEDLAARVALIRGGRIAAAYGSVRPGREEFSFEAEAGNAEILAAANGFVSGPIPLEVRADENVEISIAEWREGRAVLGTVLDDAGRPVAGAIVRVVAGAGPPQGTDSPLVLERADGRGRFRIEALPPLSDLHLYASSGSRLSRPVPVDPKGGGLELELVLDGRR